MQTRNSGLMGHGMKTKELPLTARSLETTLIFHPYLRRQYLPSQWAKARNGDLEDEREPVVFDAADALPDEAPGTYRLMKCFFLQ